MIDLTPTTAPTLDTVRERLTNQEIKRRTNRFGIGDLAQQLFELTPQVVEHQAAFEAAGYDDVQQRLIECHRLLTLGGHLTADETKARVDLRALTQQQEEVRTRLVAMRDAAVRLARDVDVDPRLFSVRLSRKNAGRLIVPARALENLLEEHGALLDSDALVADILRDLKADIATLVRTELGQEAGKHEAVLPAGLRRKAREALYAHLLHFSRVGFAVFRYDPVLRDAFSLSLLNATTRGPARREDDAPDADDATADAGSTVDASADAGSTSDATAVPASVASAALAGASSVANGALA